MTKKVQQKSNKQPSKAKALPAPKAKSSFSMEVNHSHIFNPSVVTMQFPRLVYLSVCTVGLYFFFQILNELLYFAVEF